MSYDPSYLDFVLEQLGYGLSGLNHRPMFGGVGIYAHGTFFALITGDTDTLFFYVGDSPAPEYDEQGMGYFGKRYREVPIGVLENTEELRIWAEKSLRAAQQKGSKGMARPKNRS